MGRGSCSRLNALGSSLSVSSWRSLVPRRGRMTRSLCLRAKRRTLRHYNEDYHAYVRRVRGVREKDQGPRGVARDKALAYLREVNKILPNLGATAADMAPRFSDPLIKQGAALIERDFMIRSCGWRSTGSRFAMPRNIPSGKNYSARCSPICVRSTTARKFG